MALTVEKKKSLCLKSSCFILDQKSRWVLRVSEGGNWGLESAQYFICWGRGRGGGKEGLTASYLSLVLLIYIIKKLLTFLQIVSVNLAFVKFANKDLVNWFLFSLFG
ncbi:unnamed protein product [Ixodes persulcatus]